MRTVRMAAVAVILAGVATLRSTPVRATQATYGHCPEAEDGSEHQFLGGPTGTVCKTCAGDELGCHTQWVAQGCNLHDPCPTQ